MPSLRRSGSLVLSRTQASRADDTGSGASSVKRRAAISRKQSRPPASHPKPEPLAAASIKPCSTLPRLARSSTSGSAIKVLPAITRWNCLRAFVYALVLVRPGWTASAGRPTVARAAEPSHDLRVVRILLVEECLVIVDGHGNEGVRPIVVAREQAASRSRSTLPSINSTLRKSSGLTT